MYVYKKSYIPRIYEKDGSGELRHINYTLSQFGTHVLMNPDLTKINGQMASENGVLGFPSTLRAGHHVHIYFSYKSLDIENGMLLEFITRCKELGIKKVYIHINKDRADILKIVKEALLKEQHWRIIFEKSSHSTAFRWDETTNPGKYFIVRWRGIEKINVWFSKLHNEKGDQ